MAFLALEAWPAPRASRETSRRQRSNRRAGTCFLRRGADADRDAVVGGRTRLRVSRLRGQRPADFEMTLNFGIALTRLAAEDPAVHKLTVEVQHLLKPRSVYRDPELVQRVLAKMAEV